MRAVPVLAMLAVFGALVQPGAGDDADPFEDNEDGWTGAEDEKGAVAQFSARKPCSAWARYN